MGGPQRQQCSDMTDNVPMSLLVILVFLCKGGVNTTATTSGEKDEIRKGSQEAG